MTLFLALSAPTVEVSLRMLSLGGILSVPFWPVFFSSSSTPSSCRLQSVIVGLTHPAVGWTVVPSPALLLQEAEWLPGLVCKSHYLQTGAVIAFLSSRVFCPPSPGRHAGCIIRSAVLPCWGAAKGRVSLDSGCAAFSRRCKMICSSHPWDAQRQPRARLVHVHPSKVS